MTVDTATRLRSAFWYYLVWGMYNAGHLVSYVINNRFAGITYPIYNWLMWKSLDIQTKRGIENGPWEKGDEENYD